ncbi:hypothetical protein Q3W71_17175 [Micromonospora sp. C28SCA-DRY-2]|uniref:hypothetical protein n=1 Tax=Micromonospora sp. C28SCA-DRY-2 TaxID=3059522 RepID=UPI002676C1DC|nr:hypothetical protein [Micromonospora sp. C28SCA-DRY-2]MDO3703407.1 hypothetical protein [Micromonospora sp. C28SCA-DRY-2]
MISKLDGTPPVEETPWPCCQTARKVDELVATDPPAAPPSLVIGVVRDGALAHSPPPAAPHRPGRRPAVRIGSINADDDGPPPW